MKRKSLESLSPDSLSFWAVNEAANRIVAYDYRALAKSRWPERVYQALRQRDTP